MENFRKRKIQTFEFCISFENTGKLISDIIDNLESNLIILSPNDFSLSFSDLLEEVFNTCEELPNLMSIDANEPHLVAIAVPWRPLAPLEDDRLGRVVAGGRRGLKGALGRRGLVEGSLDLIVADLGRGAVFPAGLECDCGLDSLDVLW